MSNRDRQRSGQRPGAPSDQTPPERPAAGAELPEVDQAAAGDVAGSTALQGPAEVDQVDQTAAAAPDVHSVLASLHGRIRTVEHFLQQGRGDQIALNEQVAELRRVVTQNADSLDAMAELIAGPPPPETAAPEVLPPPPPPPAHERPPVPGDEGMGVGGIAHRRREGGPRTFTPTAPIAEQAPRTLPRALPPMRPALARPGGPVATAQLGVPNHLDVGGELHIDPSKPGEHEVMTATGPVLIRVREQQRPGGFRRQSGRVFTPPKPAQGGR